MSTKNSSKHDLKQIAGQFRLLGDFHKSEPYGSGHINDTYAVTYCQGGACIRYILQRINHNIFKVPPALMENIERVTSHQRKKLAASGGSDRGALEVIKTHDNMPYYRDDNGNYWRMYIFIEGAKTYDVIENTTQAFQAAKAFGEFQGLLVDIPGGRLHETIPDFHNTPKRLQALEQAIAADVRNRAKDVKAEIDFVMKRRMDTELLLTLNAKGEIPERITHNDTKLNNVMLDEKTGEAVCVIDLDTVMPGLALYDFGDLVRTSTSPAKEDEKDLSKVNMQMHMFEALVKGYLSTAGGFLTKAERDNLAFSGKLITLEIGIRFLTDYLAGDVYFKVHREGHNVDRCRTQFKLVDSIEQQLEKMDKIVHNSK